MARFVALLIVSAVMLLPAQTISGVVRDSVLGVPIAGVVVIASDSAEGRTNRTLTDLTGRYTVAVPDSVTTFTLRFLRIGYLPRRFTGLRTDAGHLDIALTRIPFVLPAVVSRANPRCPRRADNEDALMLWEQARFGLLAAIVGREVGRQTVTAYKYHGAYESGELQPLLVEKVTGSWAHAFGAAKPTSDFMRRGFLQPDSVGRTFYGPDADVLLDTAFALAYCFRLASHPTRPTDVGLRFSRPDANVRRVDIAGVLWIDTTQQRLRAVNYRFLAGGRIPIGDGRLDFTAMPTGQVELTTWYIRHGEGRGAGVVDGAVLGEVRWETGERWSATLPSVRVHVTSAAGTPSGVTVALDSTSYAASPDSLGYAELAGVLPGPYRVVVTDRVLSLLGYELAAPVRIQVDSTGVREVDVRVSTPIDVAQRICAGATSDQATAVIVHTIGPDGKPRRVKWSAGPRTGTTDAQGHVEFCADLSQESSIGMTFDCTDCPAVTVPLRPVLSGAVVRLP